MTTAQYALNVALLVYILATNLGTRRLARDRIVVPVLLVAVAAVVFLRHVPTRGHDVTLELVGLAAGILFGLLAGRLVSVRSDAAGAVVTHADAAYAALWIAVIGGRVLFAYGADHWFARRIGLFSMRHQISGADAWTAAFVLMALAMVLTRVAVTAYRARRVGVLPQVVPA